MKIYKGTRDVNGIRVTVNGEPLDPRTDLRDFRADGFEWGYDGSGPRQLAFAMLADMDGSEAAFQRYRDFTTDVIAEMDDDVWSMTSEDIGESQEGIVYVDMTLDTLLKKVRGEID